MSDWTKETRTAWYSPTGRCWVVTVKTWHGAYTWVTFRKPSWA